MEAVHEKEKHQVLEVCVCLTVHSKDLQKVLRQDSHLGATVKQIQSITAIRAITPIICSNEVGYAVFRSPQQAVSGSSFLIDQN